MKKAALVISGSVFLIATSVVGASVENNISIHTNTDSGTSNVNVNNSVSSHSSSQTSEQTKVEMHQTGEGTSHVSVNGKNYDLDGPGDISSDKMPNSSTSSTEVSEDKSSASPSAFFSDRDDATSSASETHLNALQTVINIFQSLIIKIEKMF